MDPQPSIMQMERLMRYHISAPLTVMLTSLHTVTPESQGLRPRIHNRKPSSLSLMRYLFSPDTPGKRALKPSGIDFINILFTVRDGLRRDLMFTTRTRN